MEKLISLSAVSMKTTLKYRRDWNKNGPTVQLLRKLMPRDKTGYRLYVPIGTQASGKNPVPPMAVRHALRVAGYKVSDYLAKKCVKIKDKEQKNVYNIGKVIGKDPVAKAAFDNDPQLQNTASGSEFQMVVSCHPYDIIGMSTGRDWDNTSCMRLKDGREGMRDGAYHEHLEHDVAEGTLVVYAVRNGDENIQNPLLRCLLKPFHNEDDPNTILYRRETRIYGNNVPGFAETLAKFMRTLNKGIPPGFYKINEHLYQDGVGSEHNYLGSEKQVMPDWEYNVDDHLEERPQLFPAFLQYLTDDLKKDENDDEAYERAQSHVRQIFMYYINKLDAKYIKQAARVWATSPMMVQAFYNYAVEGNDVPRISVLMSVKEMREALKKVKRKPRAESREDVRETMSFFSQSVQKEYAQHLQEDYDMGVAAIKLLQEEVKLRTSDIMANSRLHSYIWYLANLTRDSMLYGVSIYQTAAHRLLAILPKPEKLNMSLSEMASAIYGNGASDMAALLAVMYLTAAKENDTALLNSMKKMVPNILANTCKERKFRRAFLALPLAEDISEMIKERASDGMTPDMERDFVAYVKEKGLDCNSWIGLRQTLSQKPEWLPYMYYNQIEEDLDAIDYMLESRIRAFLKPYIDWTIPITAMNPYQQLLFDFIGSVLSLREVPPKLPFSFTTEGIREHIITSRHLLSTGASYKTFPEALDRHSAEDIPPLEFIGNDLGVSSMEAFEKGRDLNQAARLMEATFASCAGSHNIVDAMGELRGNALPRSRMAQYAGRGGKAAIQAFQNGLDYCSKLFSFIETYPNYNAPKAEFRKEVDEFYKDTYSPEAIEAGFKAVRDVAYLFANEMDDLQERTAHMVRAFVNYDGSQEATYRELAKSFTLTLANWRDKYLTAEGETSEEDSTS